MHRLLVISLGMALISAASAPKKPKIWILGDSTASIWPASAYPQMGWAQVLQERLYADSAEVQDKALAGRSSKSFLTDPAGWPAFKDLIAAGDYMVIQFGHNDEKTDPTLSTLPGSTFEQYLSIYIDFARKVGAIPILATSIQRNFWNSDGKTLTQSHVIAGRGDYPQATRNLAASKNVALVDMTRLTNDYLESIGKAAATRLFVDAAHRRLGEGIHGFPRSRSGSPAFRKSRPRWKRSGTDRVRGKSLRLLDLGHEGKSRERSRQGGRRQYPVLDLEGRESSLTGEIHPALPGIRKRIALAVDRNPLGSGPGSADRREAPSLEIPFTLVNVGRAGPGPPTGWNEAAPGLNDPEFPKDDGLPLLERSIGRAQSAILGASCGDLPVPTARSRLAMPSRQRHTRKGQMRGLPSTAVKGISMSNTRRGRLLVAAIALLLLILASSASAGGQTIQNDVFWKDTDGNPMYVQRGGTLKVGDTWYMYGSVYGSATTYYNQWTGSKATTPPGAAACYSSKDLVHWKFEGAVFKFGGWFCGPNVAYNKNTRKYVLIAQANNDVVFATADSPTGPFTQHHVETPSPITNGGTGDATTFIDDDGTPYIIASSKSGRSHVYVIPLRASDYLACEKPVEIFSGAGREGNCMFKYKGRYYAASSDLHGWNTSHTYYISSDKILGPYGKEKIMANTDLDYSHVTQSGFFITVNGTVDTTVIYCGDRWCNNTGNGIGYNQWCPLSFDGNDVIFNSLSQWSIDAVTGTWKFGPGTNYILNPAFEADRITVSSVIGWEGNDPNAKGSPGAGEFCLSLGAGAKATQSIPQSSTIAAMPNGTYELKAKVRSSGGNCQISISGFGGSDLGKSSTAGSWTEVSIPGIKISTGKAVVTASNSGGGTCTMDDFSLVGSDVVGVAGNPGRMHQGFAFDPATYRIQPKGWEGGTVRLELYTADGKRVLRERLTGFGTEPYRLPADQLGSGNYLLKVSSDGNSGVQKISLGR